MSSPAILLGIESSCDDTAAAVVAGGRVLSSIVSHQLEHADFGGVVPELASRMHQVYVGAVVQKALREAGVEPQELSAVAFTQGPGLLGALLVGTSFAKGYALGLGLPLVPVNHLQGHLMSLYLAEEAQPNGSVVVLTVSGGHTQLDRMDAPLATGRLGQTIDDAAGEAFDKTAKLLGLPYPGGPAMDRLASEGQRRHPFKAPSPAGFDFSFSGLKTAVLYYLRDQLAKDESFIEQHRNDLCASIQGAIVDVLLDKLFAAADHEGVKEVAVVGGVSANRELRRRLTAGCEARGLRAYVPALAYCTDNAAMIALAGEALFRQGRVGDAHVQPYASEAGR